MGYFEIFIALFSLILIIYSLRDKNGLPTNWPLVGMLPAPLKNLHWINDYITEAIEKAQMTFHFKGPWFTNMHVLITVDPANVHHVMNKNFINYPKGSKSKEMLDVLGDGIFNTDSTLWQYHRKMAQSFLGHPRFHPFLLKKTWEKVESGLIPVLDYVSKKGIEVDLQDLFERFTFDTICTIVMGHDPRSLSIDFPSVPSSKALSNVEQTIAYRHLVPTCIWKFQRRLGVGHEKKYRQAWKTLDAFIYECIFRKREQIRNGQSKAKEDELDAGLLTLYMDENKNIGKNDDKFLRDTILNFFIAGRDTTSTTLSWFFYMLSKNPRVVSKIRAEIDANIMQTQENNKKARPNLSRNSKEFVYLHGALCEALRLYPPVVYGTKTPVEPDILPSGHRVNPNMQILFALYAMARMKSIWGDDCHEFKPERWISENGKIKHEPSYKFLAFNAGPRTCLGKDMAFTQMKAVAATIIQNYHIQAVEDHPVVPDLSIILHMKHGFKVKVLNNISI